MAVESLPFKKAKNTEIEPGIIYLNYIPPLMTVKQIRKYFSKHGEIGRIYLKPGKRDSRKKYYTEGWVEFMNKKVAKRTASILNGEQVGGKRQTSYYECLWSIKYLHKFRWTHLSEKIAYERAARKQKMRAEISQAKREVDWFGRMSWSKRKKKS